MTISNILEKMGNKRYSLTTYDDDDDDDEPTFKLNGWRLYCNSWQDWKESYLTLTC